MRKEKLSLLVAKDLKQEDEFIKNSLKLQRLRDEYKQFSKAAGLATQNERHQLLGFDRSIAQQAVQKGKEREALEMQIRNILKSDKTNKTVNPEKQKPHMLNSKEYSQGKSVVTLSIPEIQDLVDKYHGTGKIIFSDKGEFNNKEIIYRGDDYVGYTVNELGERFQTRHFKIHYSKTGVHIVPYKKKVVK